MGCAGSKRTGLSKFGLVGDVEVYDPKSKESVSFTDLRIAEDRQQRGFGVSDVKLNVSPKGKSYKNRVTLFGEEGEDSEDYYYDDEGDEGDYYYDEGDDEGDDDENYPGGDTAVGVGMQYSDEEEEDEVLDRGEYLQRELARYYKR